MAQGVAMPFFFVPTTQIALIVGAAADETASAAGLSNFLRTISAAFCAALATTWWDNAGVPQPLQHGRRAQRHRRRSQPR